MSTQEPTWKTRLGTRLEQFSHDVFDAFRWMMSVGIARYIAIKTDSALSMAVSHALGAVLLIFLMAVFLLRGEITVFRGSGRMATIGNLIVNMMICVGAFAMCIWLTYAMVDVFVNYQGK
ncbi:MAG: hypothetical protein ABJR46_09040 [Tateyamaria sp.]|uniref:hypothetical protein n=1 Tax=Tateyamaria sp. TaxID=1929288 RepID=UPI00329DC2F5